MAELSTYMEDRIVNFMRNVAITGEAAVYVALFTADDGLEGGTITSEVADAYDYARQLAGLSASSDGVSANASDITFGPANGGAWGTITHLALIDSGTHAAGNVIMHSALDASKTVADGDTFKINAGDLDVTVA